MQTIIFKIAIQYTLPSSVSPIYCNIVNRNIIRIHNIKKRTLDNVGKNISKLLAGALTRATKIRRVWGHPRYEITEK